MLVHQRVTDLNCEKNRGSSLGFLGGATSYLSGQGYRFRNGETQGINMDQQTKGFDLKKSPLLKPLGSAPTTSINIVIPCNSNDNNIYILYIYIM